MEPSAHLSDADAILSRLRRFVTLWRILFITQLTAILLASVIVLMDVFLPGVISELFGGHLSGLFLVVSVVVLVYGLDLASALVELAMGSLLRVEWTSLRIAGTAFTLVPGFLLLRRFLVAMSGLAWLALLLVALLVYVGSLLVVAAMTVLSLGRLSGLFRVIGLVVDFVDWVLSGLYAGVTRGLQAISPSPVIWLEVDEQLVLRLLRRRGADPGYQPA